MALITANTSNGFDTTAIQKGDFIRAQYTRWQQPQNGIVASVTASSIHVLYLTAIGNVSNFFTIYATEVERGLWTIQWSHDLAEVNTTEGDANADA